MNVPLKDMRLIRPIEIPKLKVSEISMRPPRMVVVDPATLLIEDQYQREMSSKRSRALIRQIVAGWDWRKFKPPICAETGAGLLIIDGQHTATGAATHPDIKMIPVMVVDSGALADRAESFVAHNCDRVSMTQHELFHARLATGDKPCLDISRIAKKVGAIIPRSLSREKGGDRAGMVTGINAVIEVHKKYGADTVERVLRIIAMSQKPGTTIVVYGLRDLLTHPHFKVQAANSDSTIAKALSSFRSMDIDAKHFGAVSAQSKYRAAAILLARRLEELS